MGTGAELGPRSLIVVPGGGSGEPVQEDPFCSLEPAREPVLARLGGPAPASQRFWKVPDALAACSAAGRRAARAPPCPVASGQRSVTEGRM